jgi:PAS domain S-box-containing protein
MLDEQKKSERGRLGRRAEKKASMPPMHVSELTHEQAARLMSELQIRQKELEMENEELEMAREELVATRTHYVGLYDSAPVGYLSLSKHNIIKEVKISLCRMLGLKREKLLKRRLTEFIAPESRDAFYLHWREVLLTEESHSCRVGVRCPRGWFWIRLDSTRDAGGAEGNYD